MFRATLPAYPTTWAPNENPIKWNRLMEPPDNDISLIAGFQLKNHVFTLGDQVINKVAQIKSSHENTKNSFLKNS